jgi:hypothetical protein
MNVIQAAADRECDCTLLARSLFQVGVQFAPHFFRQILASILCRKHDVNQQIGERVSQI